MPVFNHRLLREKGLVRHLEYHRKSIDDKSSDLLNQIFLLQKVNQPTKHQLNMYEHTLLTIAFLEHLIEKPFFYLYHLDQLEAQTKKYLETNDLKEIAKHIKDAPIETPILPFTNAPPLHNELTDILSVNSIKETVKLAALFHDIGKLYPLLRNTPKAQAPHGEYLFNKESQCDIFSGHEKHSSSYFDKTMNAYTDSFPPCYTNVEKGYGIYSGVFFETHYSFSEKQPKFENFSYQHAGVQFLIKNHHLFHSEYNKLQNKLSNFKKQTTYSCNYKDNFLFPLTYDETLHTEFSFPKELMHLNKNPLFPLLSLLCLADSMATIRPNRQNNYKIMEQLHTSILEFHFNYR
jgi:hypothetical protein